MRRHEILDPVDGLDQKAWAAAGFSISQMNRWGDHFNHPADAAPYMGLLDPAEALAWHVAFPRRPQVASTAHEAGWTVADVELFEPWVFHALVSDRTWTAARPGMNYDQAWTAYTVDLIGIGASPEELSACLRAGLTMAEITDAHTTGSLNLADLEIMAALREALAHD